MNRIKQIKLTAAATLLALGGSVFAQNVQTLEKLAKDQQAAQKVSKEAYAENGAFGMKFEHHTLSNKNRWNKKYTFNISAYKNPVLMALPQDRAKPMIGFQLAGLQGKKAKSLGWIGFKHLKDKAFTIKLHKGSNKYKEIQIARVNFNCDIWIAEADTINKLWDEYLKPDFMFYKNTLLPELKKAGFTDYQLFNTMQMFHGKQFPITPQAMASLITKSCKSGLKKKAKALSKSLTSWNEVPALLKLYLEDYELAAITNKVESINPDQIKEAVGKFTNNTIKAKYAADADRLEAKRAAVLKKLNTADKDAIKAGEAFIADCREILLANPLLDNMELLAIRRKVGERVVRDHTQSLLYPGSPGVITGNRYQDGFNLGAPKLATHSIITTLWTNQKWKSDIVKLSNLRGDVKTTELFKAPDDISLISNARAHWDGNRVAFTMGSPRKTMSLYELDASTGKTRQLSPKDSKDHYVDSCYLPDGNIITMSTAIMTALPCENGSHLLSNMYNLNPETGKIRQLGVDQENSYHATVTEDGRVMYVRYEYTDTAHYFTRVLMKMNPDGTNQREIYGSNSVWPTSIFYPQEVPGNSNMFTTVVSGHHGRSHMGKLLQFDVSKGRRETDGVTQFIGDKNRPVEATVKDHLYADEYPVYMYSTPLDENFNITMMKPSLFEPWGLYLVDTFDNKTLIHESKDHFIAWPQIMNKRKTPPVIPSRIDTESKTSTIYIQDIYQGPGLKGIPRGDVKELGVYAFHYGYQKAASHNIIGIEGPWDARYILGKVPVNADGSVIFNVPAMMPISLMPLDKNGAALQKMRSWMNPQPGEFLSCVGCHETADHSPVNKPTMASKMKPLELQPWGGKKRPYSFVMDVQPVLDKHCISCHDGSGKKPDLRNDFTKKDMLQTKKYSKSYTALQKYVRRQGPEGDYRLPVPMEWHASSSKLIQMLQKGHHGVELDDKAMRDLYMWIDLNVPFHAAWNPRKYGSIGAQDTARHENLIKYANLDWNPEEEYKQLVDEYVAKPPVTSAKPNTAAIRSLKKVKISNWPFSADMAAKKQQKAGKTAMVVEYGKAGREIISYNKSREIKKKLTKPERIEFVRIPAGKYVMGDDDNYQNEAPRVVEIKKPFWMSTTEITNTQFSTFDPKHDSRFADIPGKDQKKRGVDLYKETQPAVRISYDQATAYCEWLSKETGKKVTLPTEEQWEWAARAGTDTDMWYGNRKQSFAKSANLSDMERKRWFHWGNKPTYFNYEKKVNDKSGVTSSVKSYKPNPWGLYDMIGNAEEWTTSTDKDGNRIVKGGSWFDVPEDATSATRFAYNPSMRLPDLGFRIIIEE